MDPHLRTIREWNKDYLPREKEAYHEARINGYIFPLGSDDKIGSLSSDELELIASHPPNIDLKRYKYYSSMNMEDLEKEFPALVDIIGPSITYEDLFYQATRGWIPEYDSIGLKVDRYNQYMDLSDVSKNLMDQIYGDWKGYVNSNPDQLEQTIISYDLNMDNEGAMRSIVNGLDIYLDIYTPENVYMALMDLIGS